MKRRGWRIGGALLMAGCLLQAPARAQGADDALDEEAPTDEEGIALEDEQDVEAEPDPEAADEPPEARGGKAEDAELVADAERGSSPVELPGKTYHFVGLRYRAVIVPKFMVNLFGQGGRTVVAHALGPEFVIRKDGFEYGLSMWFAGYGMEPTPFKAEDDPVDAWEVVESKLKVIYLTADFLWSQEFTPEFALNYGVGAGFGIVFGDLLRTEAHFPGDGPGPNGEGAVPCNGVGDPDPTFCEADGNYGNEPSWANGGSKPILFPWLALQTGLRYKPHRNFVARLDLGFGTSGFLIGVGADYGL